MENHILLLSIEIKSEVLESIGSFLIELSELIRAEEGCMQFDLMQSANDPCVMVIYEKWQNRRLWQNHLQSKHMITFNKITKDAFNLFEVAELTPLKSGLL